MAKLGVREEAKRLALTNQRESPSIVESYIFSSDEEIRLIHVDRDALPDSRIAIFEFAPDPTEGIHYRSQIGIVSTESVRSATPPAQWGAWEDAERIDRGRRRAA